MIAVSPLPTFDHVKKMLEGAYAGNAAYDDTVVLLGYNICKPEDIIDMKKNRFAGKKFVIFQLEQLHPDIHWARPEKLAVLKLADEVWDYDLGNIEYLARIMRINAKFHPMLYTEALKMETPETEIVPDIDVLFYGAFNERRGKIMAELEKKLSWDVNIQWIRGVWGDNLDAYIRRSKIIINLHYYPTIIQEQVRLFYLLSNEKFVLGEKSRNNYFKDSVLELDVHHLAPAIKDIVADKSWESRGINSTKNFRAQSEKFLAGRS
jgi:hypothetical protein